MSRLTDLIRFYALINDLKQRLGGSRSLAELGSRLIHSQNATAAASATAERKFFASLS